MKKYVYIIATLLVATLFLNSLWVNADTIQNQNVDGNETYLIGSYREINNKGYTMGNVSRDNKINSRDALMILKHSAGIEYLDEQLEIIADVDFDGKITASDALIVLKYSAKMYSAEGMKIEFNDCIKVQSARQFSGMNHYVISSIEEYQEYMKDMECYEYGTVDILNSYFAEEFFVGNTLIAIKDQESSFSIKVNFEEIVKEDDKIVVKLSKIYPEGLYMDAGLWELFIPVEGKSVSEENVIIDVTTLDLTTVGYK